MSSDDLTRVTVVPRLAPRPRDSNKGTYGRVLVVAGSRGMSGAAILCASAALRSGAGLVFVAVPDSIWPVVASGNPCLITVPLPDEETAARELVLEEYRSCTVAVVGPGLGKSTIAQSLIRALLNEEGPGLVIDADALNFLASVRESDAKLFPIGRRKPVVMTPHPGEFARLIHSDVKTVQSDRERLAVEYARRERVTLVLKGVDTVVTDGKQLYVNTTGNPGMATGGTGDVLAGLIGALRGGGLDGFDAATLGTYLHGLAGDLARNKLGEVGLIASDLVDWLAQAFLHHQGS
jgi:ADP-dependent NAD(P)H-hydrate dehydratase